MKKKIRLGINGFGRIGRAFFRINLLHSEYQIVAINELDPDLENIAYLLKYDSTYGKLSKNKVYTNKNSIIVDDCKIRVYNKGNIDEVPWQEHEIDVVIDSSGTYKNVKLSRQLIEQGRIKKVIITHSPKDSVDMTLMMGVNDEKYDTSKHQIISSSICDANAVAPFFHLINQSFPIEMGEITTLHPWLSYQNVLDGHLSSASSPGHFWNDFALGRNSTLSLIPKSTTLISALSKVIPEAGIVLDAMSFRTPTSIVSAACGTFILKNRTTLEEIVKTINNYSSSYPDVLKYENKSLVSIDYLSNENAAVIDGRWLKIINQSMLKFVLWYDNEWGYAKRTYNLVKFIL